LKYLDAQKIERAHFIGESLGGWISAWLGIHHPTRVRSLQLVAAGGTKADPAVMARIKESTRKAVQTDDVELTRKRLHLLMHDPVNVSDELVEIRHRIYHQPDFVANIDNLLCMQEMDIRQRNLLRPEDLAKIKAPTLIVWGHENPFGGVPEATAMHQNIKGSKLELFEACGHWPQHEHAARYNKLSLEFLAANKSA
jgi:2-hydroxy-6-oxonona-2,4-dienedioate hydrolase